MPVTPHPLLAVAEIPAVEPYLRTVGEIFRSFREQDSGCVSYGVQLPDGESWFVKEATTAPARASLDRARVFHQAVRHPVIVPQSHRIAVADGGRTAVVMPWCDGKSLYGPARARFRALPLASVLRAVDRVLDAHLAVEAAGMVAVDLYDGAFLYDFGGDALHLIDLDEYRPGPFVLDEDRLPGSARFMAPEEWHRGARVDIRTTVYALGRSAHVLLDGGERRAWRGTAGQLAVLERATRDDPAERFAGVREFTDAWRAAT
ncbi:serine/threonine protein kinase [Streptomyces sp. W16]|uniref:serine/threonine protein kinase n=1 Tax=Streptomyces sp. W16 TaxID=3076631 RepID=UPI00295BDBF5|nr:serine/threonine protein kinase [Streptomyces sp. W16]MDV9177591.1 serine/threonine protein kinase [Streptomyces sp. W16]